MLPCCCFPLAPPWPAPSPKVALVNVPVPPLWTVLCPGPWGPDNSTLKWTEMPTHGSPHRQSPQTPPPSPACWTPIPGPQRNPEVGAIIPIWKWENRGSESGEWQAWGLSPDILCLSSWPQAYPLSQIRVPDAVPDACVLGLRLDLDLWENQASGRGQGQGKDSRPGGGEEPAPWMSGPRSQWQSRDSEPHVRGGARGWKRGADCPEAGGEGRV